MASFRHNAACRVHILTEDSKIVKDEALRLNLMVEVEGLAHRFAFSPAASYGNLRPPGLTIRSA